MSIRHEIYVFIFAIGFITNSAYALGVGGIKHDSYLNQPLNAKISIRGTSDELDSTHAKLAKPEEFDKSGIEYSSIVRKLKFEVETVKGKPHIKVYTREIVTDPFINFLVEITWPGGRMVREYSILLDPPTSQ